MIVIKDLLVSVRCLELPSKQGRQPGVPGPLLVRRRYISLDKSV